MVKGASSVTEQYTRSSTKPLLAKEYQYPSSTTIWAPTSGLRGLRNAIMPLSHAREVR